MIALKRPKRNVKRFFAAMLCVALIIEGMGMQVLAETVPVANTEEELLAKNASEELTGTTDGTVDGADIWVSGEYCEGVTWTLYDGGLFVVEGTAAETVGAGAENYTRGWEDYATDIVSAKVSAKGIKNLSYFFAGCRYLESVDFSGFETSQATDMTSMFDGCRRLTYIDLSAFDTTNVTNMSYMFAGCKKVSNLDVSKFDTRNVTDMSGMFGSCESLTDLDVTKFVTTQVVSMSYMFGGCSSLQSIDVSGFDTSKVTDMSGVFSECKNLSELKLDNFNTSQVTSMYEMFYGCKGLKTLNVTGFDTGQVSDMFFMFSECENLTGLDLSNFDMSKVVTADDMILGCAKLESINIPKNLKLTIDLHCTFADESGTEYLQLPKNMTESIVLEKSEDIYAKGHYYGMEWIIDNKGALSVTGAVDESMDMSIDDFGTHWTSYGEGITSAKLSASGVKLMANWFRDMPLLTDVDFSEFDSSQVTDMSYMFRNCKSLTTLDLSKLDLNNLKYAEEMLYGVSNLETILTPKNLSIEVSLWNAMYDEEGTFYMYMPIGLTTSICLTKTRPKTIYSGEYCEGITWTVTEDGVLTIEGEADDSLGTDEENYTRGWEEYADCIVEARVSAVGIKYLGYFFANCENLKYIDFTGFDTSQATSMNNMFEGCESLGSIDLSGFDTSNVTDMSYMFAECQSITWLNMSNFDTGNVTTLNSMFDDCESLTSLNLSGFETTKVTDMSSMFSGCNTMIQLDISNFDTGQVTDMNAMFWECENLNKLDLSNFDMKSIAFADDMLVGCAALMEIKTPKNVAVPIILHCIFSDEAGEEYAKLPKNKSESITIEKSDDLYAQGMYYGLEWIIDNEGILTISGIVDEVMNMPEASLGTHWNIYAENIKAVKISASGMKAMITWFSGLSLMTDIDLSELNTSGVTDMYALFYGCSGLTNLDLRGFDTSQVIDMGRFFCKATSLKSVDLSGFDLSNLKYAERMFDQCEALESIKTPKNLMIEIELPHVFVDSAGVEYITLPMNMSESISLQKKAAIVESGTYYGMDWILDSNAQLIISGTYDESVVGEKWSLSAKKIKVTATGVMSTASWFEDMSNLNSIDFSGFDTSEVTDMSLMFKGCNKLEYLDLSNMDMSKVTNMHGLVELCENLKAVNLSHSDMRSVEKMPFMFWRCSKLESVNFAGVNTSSVRMMQNMFYQCANLKTVDLSDFDMDNAESLTGMFAECESLETIDFSGLDTGKVKDMSYLLNYCTSLKTANLSGLDTSNLQDMEGMFSVCPQLKTVNLSDFDTSNVTNMHGLFYKCGKLNSLDLSSFDCSNVSNEDLEDDNTFILLDIGYSTALKQINTPKNLKFTVALAQTMYDENGKEYVCLPTDMKESICLTLEKPVIDDNNDKEENPGTEDDDKPGTSGTEDGDDKPDASGTEDGDDKPEIPGTEDGEDKLETPDTDNKEDVLHEEIIGTFKVSYVDDYVYTGKAIKPEVVVTYGANTLVEGVDYTVSYRNNINVATKESAKAPAITVKGKGNYASGVTLKFNIHAVEMTVDNTVVSEMIVNKTGKVQTVNPVVSVNGKKLVADKDYTIDYLDDMEGSYKEPGTYNILIKGMGNYQGRVAATLIILEDNQIMASKLKVGKIAAVDYVEGTPATPTPDVSYKGTKLELGKDYAISYKNNDRAGKATLIITGLKNVEGTYVAGSVQKTFTIKGKALKKAKADYNNKVAYNGSAICPEIKLTDGSKTLRPGIDYTVEYTKNVNVGKGTIILTGQGGYTGTVKKTFTIQADTSVVDKLQVDFAGGKAEAAFEQKGAKPAVEVMLGDTILKKGKDYTVSYKNNKKLAIANADKAPTVVIKGKGNYKFTKEVTFTIVQKQLADTDMSVVSADRFVGDKKGYISAPIVKDGNGKKLKVNKDYKIVGYTVNEAAFDGSGDVVAGTVVAVTVEGMGNYTGQTQTTYRVANNDISKVKTNKPKLEYNGDMVAFTEEMLVEGKLELADKTSGKKLVYGTDFILVGYKNNTKKGTATVTVQGIGEYGGTKNVKFSIVSKALK